jgi:hypothetical protein
MATDKPVDHKASDRSTRRPQTTDKDNQKASKPATDQPADHEATNKETQKASKTRAHTKGPFETEGAQSEKTTKPAYAEQDSRDEPWTDPEQR